MSTRSYIGVEDASGAVRAVYCHTDGYPEGVGSVLLRHYGDAGEAGDAARAGLLARGDLYAMGKGAEDARGLGDGNSNEAWPFASAEEFAEEVADSWPEFLYLYRVGAGWHVARREYPGGGLPETFSPWVPLAEADFGDPFPWGGASCPCMACRPVLAGVTQ